MKKIITVVGARPQFIKAAVVSRLIHTKYKDSFFEYLVHTGQHYDKNLSEIFFEEMEIQKPDINLNVSSPTPGKQTGDMLSKIEEVLLREKPHYVLVYGDTNSTLAGALAASKLNIPVIHVEAGLRSFNKSMQEEQNRIITDHLASILYCPTKTAADNLKSEGIYQGVQIVGDVMYDVSLYYRHLLKNKYLKNNENISLLNLPDKFYLLTLHRAENTDNHERLQSIVKALNRIDHIDAVFPIHPRTKKALQKYNLSFKSHIRLIDPVGFFDMLFLEERCTFIMTDSGGVQKEAFFFKKPCITLRDETEWIETVESGWNILTGADQNRIVNAVNNIKKPMKSAEIFGEGNAGELILSHLKSNSYA